MTPRSVLLSTNTRNAPIPLVSQRRVPIRHVSRPVVPIFLLIYHNVSRISPIPNTMTNTPLRKFILTAIVSGANQKNDLIGSISANQNAI
jgi:hypothetical protein